MGFTEWQHLFAMRNVQVKIGDFDLQGSIKITGLSECALEISYAQSCIPSLFQNQSRDHQTCSYAICEISTKRAPSHNAL
jgi:hypothetical protein